MFFLEASVNVTQRESNFTGLANCQSWLAGYAGKLCSRVSLGERSEHAGLSNSELKLHKLDQYSIPFNFVNLKKIQTNGNLLCPKATLRAKWVQRYEGKNYKFENLKIKSKFKFLLKKPKFTRSCMFIPP